jgi:hypothetical protein
MVKPGYGLTILAYIYDMLFWRIYGLTAEIDHFRRGVSGGQRPDLVYFHGTLRECCRLPVCNVTSSGLAVSSWVGTFTGCRLSSCGDPNCPEMNS